MTARTEWHDTFSSWTNFSPEKHLTTAFTDSDYSHAERNIPLSRINTFAAQRVHLAIRRYLAVNSRILAVTIHLDHGTDTPTSEPKNAVAPEIANILRGDNFLSSLQRRFEAGAGSEIKFKKRFKSNRLTCSVIEEMIFFGDEFE